MLSVSPNAGLSHSLLTQRGRNQSKINLALERLSTGKRINHAKDDPAGLVAAEELRGELTDLKANLKSSRLIGLRQRQQETNLASVQRSLGDLRGSVVEATGDQLGADEKRAIQVTVDATIESIDRLGGDEAPTTLYPLESRGAANLVDGDTAQAQEIIESTIDSVLNERATVAADQRIRGYEEHLFEDRIVITTETLSLIEDADFAEESSNLAQGQILTQAATAALAYAQQSHAEAIGALLDRVDLPGGKPA